MKSILAYGKVTGRTLDRFSDKVTYIINDNSAFYTTNGSLLDRAIHSGRAGFFVINNESYVTDYHEFGYKNYYVDLQRVRAGELKMATERLIAAYKQLGRNDIQVVAGALGTAVGGTVLLSGTIGLLTSIVTGDITGTLGSAAGAAVGGAMAYISYDSMTKAMKNAYNVSKQFTAALDTYHSLCYNYAPEHMKDLPMYDPEFEAISKLLRTIFPNFGEKDLTYNQPNWSVA